MERLTLSPTRLLEHHPRLIVGSGKGYGTSGPYAHMSAMDITVQAAGVPCAPVKSMRELDTDPHLIKRGMIQHIHHLTRGRTPRPRLPTPTHRLTTRPLRPAHPSASQPTNSPRGDTVPARH
jgi:crotonobetainyl-CoA:carnitine CoA-transferase CaiB-like acyl-CoA transferase